MIAAATGVAAATLSVSPVRVRLTGAEGRTITIANAGNAATTIDTRAAGLAVDRRGRPQVASRRGPAAAWLRLRPRTFVLGPHEVTEVAVSALTPAGATPGDHAAVVLFATRASGAAGVAVRMQIGVVVIVRVAGRIVRRLELGRLSVRQRTLEAAVANRGNVVERMRIRIALTRRGHVVARLRSAPRTLLAHSHGTVRVRYPRRLRGLFVVRISAGAVQRTVRLRL